MSADTARPSVSHVNTAIIGNGPSALILSFILSGNIPYYDGNHVDSHLHQHLAQAPDLLHIDPCIFDHIRSSLKYSSQALPINVVLDALQRPDRDVSDAPATCIKWVPEPHRSVDHVVLGEASRPGGQWTENPVFTTWSIGTLSYAEQLSLPGFSFAEFWKQAHGADLPEFIRPSRTDVADYYAAYPSAVGIDGRIQTATKVRGVSRTSTGFHIASHGLTCDNIVLATGTFSINLPPPRALSPLTGPARGNGPVLIVGSGFTAADLIVSTPPNRKIIHVYNWSPEERPSPLQGCHSQAYPEYAWIYRQMKLAASRQGQDRGRLRSMKFKAVSALPYFNDRDWTNDYEGFANAEMLAAACPDRSEASPQPASTPDPPAESRTVCIRPAGVDEPITRAISEMHYATGRRGSLSYLSPALLHELLETSAPARAPDDPDPWNGPADSAPPSHASPRTSTDALGDAFARPPAVVSGSTLRPKLDELGCMRLAPGAFVVGSLTGDSLVRFALGGCCDVAGRVLDAQRPRGAPAALGGDEADAGVRAPAASAPETTCSSDVTQEQSESKEGQDGGEDTRGRVKKKRSLCCLVS